MDREVNGKSFLEETLRMCVTIEKSVQIVSVVSLLKNL